MNKNSTIADITSEIFEAIYKWGVIGFDKNEARDAFEKMIMVLKLKIECDQLLKQLGEIREMKNNVDK
jgi:hypothetical protein